MENVQDLSSNSLLLGSLNNVIVISLFSGTGQTTEPRSGFDGIDIHSTGYFRKKKVSYF